MFHHFKKSLAALLIVCVMAPGFYMGMAPAQKAEASIESIFAGTVGAVAACAVMSVMSYAAQVMSLVSAMTSVPVDETNPKIHYYAQDTAKSTSMTSFKECVLDALAWAAKNIVIEFILKEIVDWINQGFEGGPAFLSDVNGFFKDVAFGVFDQFLLDSGLDQLLCAPFQQDVFSFMAKVRFETKSYKCSIEDLVNNGGYDNMVNNGNISFAGGGIQAAMSLATAGSNPYSAIFDVQAEANARINNKTSNEKMLLSFGDGNFSKRCDTNNDGVKEVCTPGQFVSNQINQWMGGGLKMLENADEVSEIVAALVAALVQNTLFSEGEYKKGLLSGSKSGSQAEISQQWIDGGYVYGGGAGSQATAEGTAGAQASGVPAGYQAVWTDPETGVVWTQSDNGTWINSAGQEVTIESNGEARDANTGASVDLGSVSVGTLGSVDVGAVLGAISTESVVSTVAGMVAVGLGVPAGLVAAAQLGYGLMTGHYGIVSDLISALTSGVTPATPASVAAITSGWDNPDTPADESNALGLTNEESNTQSAQVGTDSTGDIGSPEGTGSSPGAEGGSAGTTGSGAQGTAGDAIGL